MTKLNLGCGYVMPEGWANVDKLDYDGNVMADVLESLPYPDNHFDFVLMNHTLQMFTYEELPVALNEVKRVMKEGATLRILTPDLDTALEAYKNFDKGYFPISDEIETTLSGKFARYLFWHGDTRCVFDWQSLGDLLHRHEFKMIRSSNFGACELDSREKESLIMECTK